jgi:hypothetical protein
MPASQPSDAEWERMPRIQIKRDIQQGVLFGNGVAYRCRVEITTMTSQGRPHVRQLDIWIGESLPAGEYRLVINGETLLMHYSRGLWHEVIAHLPPTST